MKFVPLENCLRPIGVNDGTNAEASSIDRPVSSSSRLNTSVSFIFLIMSFDILWM